MRARPNPVEAFVTLPRLADPAERRSAWRQAVAGLGRSTRVAGPPPLDGVSAEVLAASARVALATGLVEDLDWIAPGAAAVALYELTSALPQGAERRDFGRRVFARLYEGDASTFAAVATRMALSNAKPIEAVTMRARVGLVLDTTIGSPVHPDPLAFAFVSRRPLFERWVKAGATGALPARRMAALILERAAREAVRRTQFGDPQPRRLFVSEEVVSVTRVLLADREPLVWRHAAVARGLLAAIDDRTREDIELALDPALHLGEWRRAAVSLVSLVALDPDTALKQVRQLLKGEIAAADPGMPATLIWGLPRVVEAEPDAAEELLDRLAALRRTDVAEATADLLREVPNPEFGRRAAEIHRAALAAERSPETDVMLSIFESVLAHDERHADAGVYGSVRRALAEYENEGARSAYEAALETVSAAHRVMDGIEALSSHGSLDDPDLAALLVDLDASVLERSRLADLLLLGRRPGDAEANVPEMDRLHDRFGRWLIEREAEVPATSSEWTRAGALARRRRLKSLLHLMDVESTTRAEGDDGPSRVRDRARAAVAVLLHRIAAGPDPTVHRILCAALSRCFDATVREGLADPSDLMLVTADHLAESDSIGAIAEGSTSPDVSAALGAYVDFLQASRRDAMDSILDGSFDAAAITRDGERGDEVTIAKSVIELSQGFGSGGTYRGEALRQVVLRMGRALEAIAIARGLAELVDTAEGGGNPLGELEDAIDAYRRLCNGAKRRLLGAVDSGGDIDVVTDVARLSALVERAVSSGVPANAKQLAMAVGELTAELPNPIAAAIAQVVARVDSLPTSAHSDVFAIPLQQPRTALPDWLLPRRVIGGFYVVRSLGAGGGASVFVARRVEERHDENAEAFALKVPEYDPTTARSLSEQQFLDLFRQEAGALLGLPSHENLANFVTFDLAARPKPILVMELIRGVALDRAIRSRALSTDKVLLYLDGILRGLGAMHEVGVGHLDLKPSNVIVRQTNGSPVLVDFGLSGRHLRPGCGTLEYTAPEVLGVLPEGYDPTPMAADVYAFACTAYELLTGDLLLDGDDEAAIISLHLQHDGWPDKLVELHGIPGMSDFATVLAACLRRDPRDRPDTHTVREVLVEASGEIKNRSWPLRPSSAAAHLTA